MQQQTYEIYEANPCSCESEWQRLGDVQAVSDDEAVSLAFERFTPSQHALIVACAVSSAPLIVPVAK